MSSAGGQPGVTNATALSSRPAPPAAGSRGVGSSSCRALVLADQKRRLGALSLDVRKKEVSPHVSESLRKTASSDVHHRKKPSNEAAPIKNPMAIPPSDASDQGCAQMRRWPSVHRARSSLRSVHGIADP